MIIVGMREKNEIRICGRRRDAKRIHLDHGTRFTFNADTVLCVDRNAVCCRMTHTYFSSFVIYVLCGLPSCQKATALAAATFRESTP